MLLLVFGPMLFWLVAFIRCCSLSIIFFVIWIWSSGLCSRLVCFLDYMGYAGYPWFNLNMEMVLECIMFI